jgi:predicted nucleic acid-binding protein
LTELVRVLQYPRVQKFHRLSLDGCREFVASVEQMAEHVELSEDPGAAITTDPDDDPVIATALAGRADVLCTLDRHLHNPNMVSHCASLGIRILTDIELLDLLRKE